MRYYNNNIHKERTLRFSCGAERGNEEMEYKIALIPGDGIGPEIVNEAKKVLDKVCEKYHHTFTY